MAYCLGLRCNSWRSGWQSPGRQLVVFSCIYPFYFDKYSRWFFGAISVPPNHNNILSVFYQSLKYLLFPFWQQMTLHSVLSVLYPWRYVLCLLYFSVRDQWFSLEVVLMCWLIISIPSANTINSSKCSSRETSNK